MGITVIDTGTAVAVVNSRTFGIFDVSAYESVLFYVANPGFDSIVQYAWAIDALGATSPQGQILSLVPDVSTGLFVSLPVICTYFEPNIAFVTPATHNVTWWVAGSTHSAIALPPALGPTILGTTFTIGANASRTVPSGVLYEGPVQLEMFTDTADVVNVSFQVAIPGIGYTEVQTLSIGSERITHLLYFPFLPTRFVVTNPNTTAAHISLFALPARTSLSG